MSNCSIDASKVISWSNREEAQKYLKKAGYFGNSLEELEAAFLNENFGSCIDLNKITDEVICFVIGTDWNDYYQNYAYGLFLPADKLKEVEEKKWRAFRSFKEFSENLKKGVGSKITHRNKDVPLRIITTTIISFIEEANREDQIQIGGGILKFSTWFKEIEIFNGKEWQPFGVLEND